MAKVRLFTKRAQLTESRTPGALTDRELEVLSLAHLTNDAIAEQLGCKPSTVKAHLRHSFSKIGAANRVHAYKILSSRERLAA